ncbi:MAG TPA: Crp/Fnr family transcriptional regulator [Chitinophagales bacterium]|nr:Crp/Fnr family transcriptional regulator [Chitinophagales bacterium]
MIRFKEYLTKNYKMAESEWAMLYPYAELQQLKRGEYFVWEGKVCRSMGFISEGVMRYLRFEENGEETTCYFLGENDFVGDPESFLSQQPSKINASAITECVLVTLSYESYQKISKTFPRFNEIFLDVDIKTSRSLFNQRDLLINRDAAAKYQAFIEQYPHILSRVPLSYVASFLCIAQQSLSRLRKQLS